MLFSFLQGGDLTSILMDLLLSLPLIILALTVHETAHGYVAYKCGDSTAYNLGRLTLNPAKHLDPIGFLCMLLFGYGWAKPVPINTRNFKNPKRGMALSAAAGPLSNFLLGLFFAAGYGFLRVWYVYLVFYANPAAYTLNIVQTVISLFGLGAVYNFLFMAFNLIPVPPFDGSRIAFVFLPPRAYFAVMRYERQIMLGLLLGLFALSRFFAFSPFTWVAYKLTDLISAPVVSLFSNLLLG